MVASWVTLSRLPLPACSSAGPTYDAVTMIAAPSLRLITAIGACLEPAARATRVDAMLTLRAE